MLTSPLYGADDARIDRFVRDHPFALVISGQGASLLATPLPLMLERHAAGNRRIVGHFSRANPQINQLRAAPDALIVVQGPHGYITPSWMRDRTQAPTWNYMVVQFRARISFADGRADAVAAVDGLSSQMEKGRPLAWNPQEMGVRHAHLVRGVVPFVGEVVSTAVKFKLGQNERPDVLADILEGLEREPGVPPGLVLRNAMMETNSSSMPATIHPITSAKENYPPMAAVTAWP